MPLASWHHFFICIPSFSISFPSVQLLYSTPFWWEYRFLFMPLWFTPNFSGMQLGNKTRSGYWGRGKSKVVRVHNMKAYTGRRGTALFILNLGATSRSRGQFHGSATVPLQKEPTVLTNRMLGGLQSQSACCRDQKNFLPYWESNPKSLSYSPVHMPTQLAWLLTSAKQKSVDTKLQYPTFT